MKLHELKKSNKTKDKKRVGRGISAGGGKTAGRGTKGQKSRSGFNLPRKFEGGQTPIIMRLPKLKGFKSTSNKVTLTFSDINRNFKDDDSLSRESLIAKNLIKKTDKVKIVATGELTVKIKLIDIPASKKAKEIIEKFLIRENKSKKLFNNYS
ncbi:MAG: large subunit ribosomal protein L15 [Candidatus Berkelbacteria bacterium Athens1014_28]|uniref:Large ribosomal subunit protein uL15 n=1 Tax=Candidatus Berkelbacteria bacterium Athens1014_28 TaxID=2017145 RepID=A0A554LR33_9BACT|nr:MAG: large subunit ribosomal protein L15 [Candidatus Berkelbacteria bacterium Athens1014_28]